ncbi:phosphoglycerate kinase [Bacteroidetes/Chlorobi group bacterium MS-B_bin-24]|jgi:phosphoglycerate kinase|nr:MAG: phosphoglycerate kinase [Bacteroidetes/Chlorobi group bacterium MS-B_bin-24]
MIKSIFDYNFAGKRVLIRVDFNVPLTSDGKVADDTRIVESLTTINKVIDDGGIPILISHLGRPKGEPNPKYSLKPVADYLNEKLGYNVKFVPNCIGEEVQKVVDWAIPGEVILLENLRFHKEEESNSVEFAKELRKLADVYVNDAFASCHRAHSSIDALPRLFEEKFAGNLLLNEIHYIGKAITNPPKPYVAIIGGAKISGKIDVIQNLLEKCDTILIGGGLAYTFFKALGYNVGNSIVESEKIELAKSLLENAKSMNKPLILPKDVIIAEKLSQDSEIKNVRSEDIPEGWMGVDIGYETRLQFRDLILGARMVVWNGPVGVFEIEKFAEGTKAVALAMVEATTKGSITIVGGGDSAAAIAQLGLKDKVSHVSTGGGASLDYLAGKPLPGIFALEV